MSKKYNKVIYVQLQGEGENEYLQAERELKNIPDDGKVAIYELKEIKNRRTVIEMDQYPLPRILIKHNHFPSLADYFGAESLPEAVRQLSLLSVSAWGCDKGRKIKNN